MNGLTRSPARLLVVSATIVALTALALASSVLASSPRSGDLHLTKACPQPGYTGLAGSYCTVTSSNLKAIPVGATITYASANGVPVPGWADSDIVLDAGPGNTAFGHVNLNLMGPPPHYGVATFSGGTGKFTHFHAGPLAIVCAPINGVGNCSWDGPYSFSP